MYVLVNVGVLIKLNILSKESKRRREAGRGGRGRSSRSADKVKHFK